MKFYNESNQFSHSLQGIDVMTRGYGFLPNVRLHNFDSYLNKKMVRNSSELEEML